MQLETGSFRKDVVKNVVPETFTLITTTTKSLLKLDGYAHFIIQNITNLCSKTMPEFILGTVNREKAIQLAHTVLKSLDGLVAWRVSIDPVSDDRTNQQNRYLNGVAYKMISEHTGYERNEIHEAFLGRYFGWKTQRVPRTPTNPKGEKSRPIRTTTTNEAGKRQLLTTKEFWEYVEFLQRFAAERFQFVIPDPDPSLRVE